MLQHIATSKSAATNVTSSVKLTATIGVLVVARPAFHHPMVFSIRSFNDLLLASGPHSAKQS